MNGNIYNIAQQRRSYEEVCWLRKRIVKNEQAMQAVLSKQNIRPLTFSVGSPL